VQKPITAPGGPACYRIGARERCGVIAHHVEIDQLQYVNVHGGLRLLSP